EALGGRGRLLVVNEQIIPPGNEPHLGKLGDMTMLLIGGRERTEAEWHSLFQESGFSLTRVVPLPSLTGAGVIEGVPSDR
ncbi:MAG TPA: methyltransferase, partial [Solirubrobacteraceae bacterium]|nr:methyltransferase [Solirubrobacteraceae bacterium]